MTHQPLDGNLTFQSLSIHYYLWYMFLWTHTQEMMPLSLCPSIAEMVSLLGPAVSALDPGSHNKHFASQQFGGTLILFQGIMLARVYRILCSSSYCWIVHNSLTMVVRHCGTHWAALKESSFSSPKNGHFKALINVLCHVNLFQPNPIRDWTETCGGLWGGEASMWCGVECWSAVGPACPSLSPLCSRMERFQMQGAWRGCAEGAGMCHIIAPPWVLLESLIALCWWQHFCCFKMSGDGSSEPPQPMGAWKACRWINTSKCNGSGSGMKDELELSWARRLEGRKGGRPGLVSLPVVCSSILTLPILLSTTITCLLNSRYWAV